MADNAYVPFQSMTRRPDIQFLTTGVPAPGAVYITRDDSIMLKVRSSVANIAALMDYRVLQPDGSITPGEERLIFTGDRLVNTLNFKLPEGYLLGMSFSGLLDTTTTGVTHVRAYLVRGTGASQTRGRLLCAGYLSGIDAVGWPDLTGSPAKQSFGNIQTVTVAAPAAGVEITTTSPLNTLWRIMAARMTLVTSAVVAARLTQLQFNFGGIFNRIESPGTQAASLTRNHNYGLNFTRAAAVTDDLSNCLPDMWLPGATIISTLTDNLDIGDQYSAMVLLVEEHLSI